MEKIKSVGIIGFGRFGELTYNVLKKHFPKLELKVHSRRQEPDNKKFFSLQETAECEIVIPTVPISAFEGTVRQIAPFLKSGSLLIDVCSVKTHPAKIMQKHVPEPVEILATHPLFGPDGSKNGTSFDGLKFTYHPIRIKNTQRLESILNWLRSLKLEVIQMTPDEHDRQAAYTHAFAFLIGKLGMMLNVRKNQISTKGFEVGVLYNQLAVENDTEQLFLDMNRYNPYAKEMREMVAKALEEIEEKIAN